MATFTGTWNLVFRRDSVVDRNLYKKTWDAATTDPKIPAEFEKQLKASTVEKYKDIRLTFVISYP